jgi:hypothetical protein
MGMRWVLLLLLVLYILCPYDLIPDFLVGPGWLDDATLLGFLGWYLLRGRGRRSQRQQRRDPGDGAREGAWQGREKNAHLRSESPQRGRRDPYQVLGVAPGASPDRIKSAYRELAGKYHPDKVSHLGEEFRELAERRFKEIQQAYHELVSSQN